MPLTPTADHLAFKLLRSGRPILLSDVLPLLENMGVRVSDERPYEVRPQGREPVWIYDFGLRHDERAEFQADDVRETFQDAFARVWRDESENDGFNRLVLSAASQRGRSPCCARSRVPPPGRKHVQPDLHGGRPRRAPDRRPPARRALPAPARPVHFEDTDAKARARPRARDGDRRRRRPGRGPRSCAASCASCAPSCARTTSRPTRRAGQPYLSLKLDPDLIPDLPEPRPLFEVFVYSPRVEAVHLRGGKVARGGIRWSTAARTSAGCSG